ncbi:post-GPI attachment to proteins factor 3-like isoform X2 [Dreissena polymorpha]|uniref:Post-GPI attachment to proteins factor 3 n=1 Tax=Dreissena polymorpha TaxID=45954 RepID=A0A9D4C102_DREPO|nr:post-GPI attachment to proteins factor 3-like isoform X2 [Dreissena polymorpha]KAH3715194.1 hypothetical protein DPMN_057900 [Dreissena polymorpha]
MLLLVSSCLLVAMVTGSPGDRSYVYQKCLNNCKQRNCSEEGLKIFSSRQPPVERLIGWSCHDDCKYECMWQAVDAFKKDGLDVPQFHGKWPFVRLWGVQEPASMLFSLINGLAHLSIFWYRSRVPTSTALYYVWHVAAIMAMNAWAWSTVFHTKDTEFTEKMDYFCAFSIVVFNTFTLACRVLGTEKRCRIAAIGACCLCFFVQHISYLSIHGFGYGYNMKVNIAVALFNMVGWLYVCYKVRKPFIWKAVASIVGIQALLALELGDFPPILWTFDAHALWHAGTWPLCFLWYSFIIDDSLEMVKQKAYGTLPQALKID